MLDGEHIFPYLNRSFEQLQEQEQHFLVHVKQFVQSEVLPQTRQWEREKSFPNEIWEKLGELGLLSICLSREYGGKGFSSFAYCEACREIAKGDPALAMNIAAINALCIMHLEKFGLKDQRKKYLLGMVKGKIKLAWALTEPDAGSDARRVKTFATPIKSQPGFYHLDGQKMFITNAGHADLMVLIARTSENDLSVFLVEKNQPGVKHIERIHTVGVQASNTVRFTLEKAVGWHTPCTFEEAISLLYRGRLGIASMALGIAEKAFELTLEYSKERVQFNRKLSEMQSVQNMIADSLLEIEASRLLIQEGALSYDLGAHISLTSSMAKLYASQTANHVTNRAIQIHGGRGMTEDYLLEKLWRDAKLTEIGEGCSEIQRLIISKQILK